jgi:hypothetical protein
MPPQRGKALPECLGLFGKKPPGEALRGSDVSRLPFRNQGLKLRTPAGERLMGPGQSLQDDEVVVGAEAVAQALRLGNPQAHELRPQRVGKFHLVAMLDDALAESV